MNTDALLAALVCVPLAGALGAFAAPRAGRVIAATSAATCLLFSLALGTELQGNTLLHAVGGWGAPLGIDLYADRPAALLLLLTAIIFLIVGEYGRSYFPREEALRFWPLWLLLMASLNALLLARDLFNLYVTLELLGLAAVALTALSNARAAQRAALQYLFASLAGSLAYLLGVAFVYRTAGSLDLAVLASEDAVPAGALALMTAGLLLKAAVFPLHFWLPPAHGSAPTPVSAVLSALAVKAPLYLLLRIVVTAPAGAEDGIGGLFQIIGSAAVLWCSVQALLQSRAKRLVAYSTAAQLGYLVLALGLAGKSGAAVDALLLLLVAHALAKAALFLAVGNIMTAAGNDRLASFAHVMPSLPVTAATMALASISLMGLPPSGGFLGKWELLDAAIDTGQWSTVAVLLVGSLLATGYCFRLLQPFFSGRRPRRLTVPRAREWSALALATGAVLLGFGGASPLLTGESGP